jgi:hypothetical protein
MTCQYCNDTGWILYMKPAEGRMYQEGRQLEYAKACVCTYDPRRSNENNKRD